MKILKLRPGLLANFSGGAGYMPFVVVFSYPVACVGNLVATVLVHRAVKRVCGGARGAVPGGAVDLAEVQSAVTRTLWWLSVPAGIAALALYVWACTLIYEVTVWLLLAASLYAVVPLAAIPLGGWVVYRRALVGGPMRRHILYGVLAGGGFLLLLFTALWGLILVL